nr:plastocyanin/azurin family copper-binding protein [Phyllobacterium sp. IY22]
MLNKTLDGRMMGFEPMIVHAEPGDTVTFVATDKGHDSVSIKNGIPEGQAEWKGNISSDITVTVSAEGVNMYECNLDSLKAIKYPGKAKAVADEIFTKIAGGGQ